VRRGLVRRGPSAPSGSVVTLRTPEGVVLGEGFWNAVSDIALRRLTEGETRFDAGWLEAAVDRAVTLRERCPGLVESSGAWRAIHAEGDGLSGLIVDRYGDVAVVELHSAGWLDWLEVLLPLLHARLGTAHHRVQMSERTARLEGVAPLDTTSEGCPARVRIAEHGLRYHVDLRSGHKTGFFCDQRENRRRFAEWAAGDVLDLCCHTGGFAVATAGREAVDSVTAVELDEAAIGLARENLNLNQLRAQLVRADAFDWLRQVEASGRRFASIVLDPPKFIPTRRDIETGSLKYRDLNRLALAVLEPGGLLLTCSCSGLLSAQAFSELVATAARKITRGARVLATSGAGPDHPVNLHCPETAYLKALWVRAD
jgi:23S rRNA (cytosine1962-C5)-methyltransferase